MIVVLLIYKDIPRPLWHFYDSEIFQMIQVCLDVTWITLSSVAIASQVLSK